MKAKVNANDEILAKIQIDYERRLILPLEEGLNFMRSVASGEVLKEGYQKGKQIIPTDSSITLSLISTQEVREIKMEQVLEVNDDAKS